MPAAVASFAEKKDFAEVRAIQKKILDAYESDFSKHAPVEIVPRIRLVWNAILPQLAKENRKFIYAKIQQGARAREFELAMAWLLDCGLIKQVFRVTKPNNNYSLLMASTGLAFVALNACQPTVVRVNTMVISNDMMNISQPIEIQ